MADGSLNFDTKVDTKGFKDQIKQLETDIKNLNKQLDSLEKERELKLKFLQDNSDAYNLDKHLLRKDTPLVHEYEATLDKVIEIEDEEGKINELIDQKNRLLAETKVKLEDVNRESRTFSVSAEDTRAVSKDLVKQFTSLGNILKSRIKRALISELINGISVGFNSLMKYSPALKDEFNSMKNSLARLSGSFVATFEPILSFVIPIITKLVDWINIAITAISKFFAVLTGRNYINKAIKGQKDYASSVGATNKELNKQLAGFDEINNLSEENGSGGSGIGSGIDFEELELEAEEIAKIKQLIEDLLPIVMGVVTALALIKLGLDTLTAVGLGIMIAGIIALVQDLIDYIQDPSWENLLKILMDLGVIIAGLAIAFGVVTGGWAIALTALVALVLLFKDKIAEFLVGLGTNIANWGKEKIEAIKQWWSDFKSICVELCSQLVERVKKDWSHFGEDLKILWKNVKEGLKVLWEQLKTEVVKSATDIKNNVSDRFNTLKTNVINAWNRIKSGISSVWNSITSTVRTKTNSVIGYVENMVNRVIDGINWLTSGLRSLGNKVTEAIGFGSVFSSLSHVSLPRLATGTNYVPQNMIAEIHKGEAVVPKPFNEAQFNNSEETNDLLRQLIEIIENKEVWAKVSESEVGRSAVRYINGRSRNMGVSLV